MIKAIFFDLDGTLVDTSEVIVLGFKHLFAKYRPDYIVTKEDYKNMIGPALKDSFPFYFGKDLPFEQLLSEYRIATNHLLTKDNLKLPVNTYACLTELSKSYKLVIITSRQHHSAEFVLKAMDLDKYFDLIIGCDEVKEVKPNPESFKKALDVFGLKQEEAIMIGDSESDILGGVNAGIDSYAVSWTGFDANHLLEIGAKDIIKKMNDIFDIVKE
jgi:pyrophosphatase PpaX